MGSESVVVRAVGVSKRYGEAGEAATWALREVSVAVAGGEFLALVGRSGCGKTTLLNLLGAMDAASSGAIWLDGEDTARLGDDALTALRRRVVGFVFQAFHLLPTLTVFENIEIPLLLQPPARRLSGSARAARVRELAAAVGIEAKLASYPLQLSGGEAQRTAVARALVHRPRLILADEPTGNLDTHSAGAVLGLLTQLCRREGAALVLATHSAEAAALADTSLRLSDGRVVATELQTA